MMKKRIAACLLAAAMLAAFAGQALAAAPAAYGEPVQPEAAQEVYESLAGYYQDSVSRRAMLNTWLTDDGLGIQVHWASSAFQSSEWDMIAVLTEDNRLVYTDGVHSEITYLTEDDCEVKELAAHQQGYFTIEDGKLLWKGAADENCRDCVFELLPEEYWPQAWEPEYTGMYARSWSEEIGGTTVKLHEYYILNEDGTGYNIAQDVGMLNWDESRVEMTLGYGYDIAMINEKGIDKLLVYEFQDADGSWIPTAFERIEELPEEIAELLIGR